MAVAVCALALTPIKGTRLREVEEVEIGPLGARGDRRFFLIDDRDRMVNGKTVGELSTVLADFSPADQMLRLELPDGRVLEDEVRPGSAVRARFYSGTRDGRLVGGPFAELLSEHVGQSLRLVQAETAVDRGRRGGASLISRASVQRLARVAGQDDVDSRRFRMLVEVDGLPAHAEDEWVGARIGLGDAVIRVHGHVGRCLITSRHPETGEIDLPTLDVIRDYRGAVRSTEPLPFGIYGEVLNPGTVRVGDPVTPLQ